MATAQAGAICPELKTLYEPPTPDADHADLDIVTVHGLGADAIMWTLNGVNWLSDKHMLPSWLPRSRVMQFSYDSTWLGKETIQRQLPLVADQLLRAVVESRKNFPTRPLMFIGHCFGGLVIQKALLMSKLHEVEFPLLAKSIAGIIFMGSPLKSSRKASNAEILAATAAAVNYGELSALAKELERDSGTLAELLQDFTRLAKASDIQLFCFFETVKCALEQATEESVSTKGITFGPSPPTVSGVGNSTEFVVDDESGTLDGFPRAGLSVNHFLVNKFSQKNDPNYLLVRDQVTKVSNVARGHAAKRMQGVSNENEKCLNALFVTDPADDMEAVEHNSGRLIEGSGAWLQEEATYREWLDSRGPKVLWIHGGPGKGKTMLAISAVKSLLQKLSGRANAPNTIVAYFFCSNTDNRRDSSIAILRSIIYQILQQRLDLCSDFRAAYEREGDGLFTSPNALQSLWRVLQKLLANRSLGTVYIAVDALDELQEPSAEDLLKLLSPFLDPESEADACLTSGEQEKGCQTKWLLTSRNTHSLPHTLGQTLNISLEASSHHVEKSVWRFIEHRVGELRRAKGYTDTLSTFIRDTLRDKSEGTFLYVSMACRALAQPSVRLINTKSVLEGLPRGLVPLYERIMEQINAIEDRDLVEHAKAVLRSMVLSLRPLTLQELAVAADLPEEHHQDLDMLAEYASLCGSFIVMRQSRVHFVHETVKTYLRSLAGVICLPIERHHAKLAQCFIHHISGLEKDELGMEHEAGPLPYPSSFWAYHARQAGEFLPWEANLSLAVFSDASRARQRWLDCFWAANHQDWDPKPDGFPPLHLAAYWGISGLVSALLARGDAIKTADSHGHSALIWASRNGHHETVRVLVAGGAHLEAKTHGQRTALLWAVIKGYGQVVQELLLRGASIHVRDEMDWTPLHHAAAHGHVEIVIALLAAGADSSARDVSNSTPLQRAVLSSNLKVIEALVEKGADIHLNDKDGLSLLHLAAQEGNAGLVALLLGHCGGLETVDDQGWTPLMHAAWFGHVKAAKYLAQHGANVEAKSLDGNTPLHLATWNGHADVVQVLLDSKADANSTCNRQETPLQQAAWRGHLAVCRSLLEAGVDPNAKSDTGLTPLHQAAANGHEAVAQLLLEWGGDPNAIDLEDQIPRMRAQENNHHSLAKMLRDLEIKVGDENSAEEQDAALCEAEPLDPAVCELLKIPPECCFTQRHRKEGFSTPAKVTALVNGEAVHYFVKSGPEADMFKSEHAALRALHETVPFICPYSLGHGKFANSSHHFLLMEYLDTSNPPTSDVHLRSGGGLSLAQKLAKLHTTPAPIPPGHRQRMFGWPISTYCGSTRQDNSFRASWPKFYAENRLLAVLKLIEVHHGADTELREGVEAIVRTVVPRLLRNGHLGGREGVTPVLVHGDLWVGNRARGRIASWASGLEEVVFDPSVCYAHSEYEIGIMRMFGGFSAGFFHEYHRLVPKTKPTEEYEDRVTLYQLYQYLNHYFIFRGGYKDNALEIIDLLTEKYIKPKHDGRQDRV